MTEQPECTCDGAYSCYSADCPGNKKCEVTAWVDGAGSDYRCVPNDFGHCGCYGDPHCKGFDGAWNDVYGVSQYTLVQFGF